MKDEFPTWNKTETPLHQFTDYLYRHLISAKYLATSRYSKSVLSLNSLCLLKWSTDLKWMLRGKLSIADTVEIDGEKKNCF